jgi:hypothetical protein
MIKIRNRQNYNRWLAGAAAGLLTAVSLLGADGVILHLKNGDRVTGEITSENDDRIVFKLPFGAKIEVPKSEVASREPLSPAPSAPSSTNAPAGTAAKPPGTGGMTLALTPNPAGGTNALENPWYRPEWLRPFLTLTNWHGNVQLGSDLGFGTTDHQTFYVNATANHTYNRLHNLFSYSAAYGLIDNVESANRMDGSLKTDVDLGKARRWYAYNLAGAGYDEIQKIDLQFQEGSGFGYKIVDRPKFILKGELGAQFQHFRYAIDPSRDIYSARMGENLIWKPVGKMVITEAVFLAPNIENFGDYRAHGAVTFSYPLLNHVTLNLNVFDDYDSHPAGGVKNNILEIQTTIGVTF